MTTMTTLLSGPGGWTREERDRLPDDGRRYELLDGMLLVNAAPRPVHQRVLLGLYRDLFDRRPPTTDVLVAPVDVTLAADTVVEPDLVVARRDAFDERGLPGPPDLAVEVLSPSSRSVDRVLKFDRYRRAGVPAYWIVDPDGPTLTAFELRDGAYVQVAEVSGEQEWTAALPFPVTLTPARWAD